jgi:hypothetical protein
MGRTAVALSVSATPSERKLVEEFSELTGETPTQLVRQLVFSRLPYIVAALRELREAGIDLQNIPNFDFSSPPASDDEIRAFYSEDGESWPVKE